MDATQDEAHDERLTDADVALLEADAYCMNVPPQDGKLLVFTLDYADAPFGPMLCQGTEGLVYLLKHECLVSLADGDEITVTIKRTDMTRAEIDAAPVQ